MASCRKLHPVCKQQPLLFSMPSDQLRGDRGCAQLILSLTTKQGYKLHKLARSREAGISTRYKQLVCRAP